MNAADLNEQTLTALLQIDAAESGDGNSSTAMQ